MPAQHANSFAALMAEVNSKPVPRMVQPVAQPAREKNDEERGDNKHTEDSAPFRITAEDEEVVPAGPTRPRAAKSHWAVPGTTRPRVRLNDLIDVLKLIKLLKDELKIINAKSRGNHSIRRPDTIIQNRSRKTVREELRMLVKHKEYLVKMCGARNQRANPGLRDLLEYSVTTRFLFCTPVKIGPIHASNTVTKRQFEQMAQSYRAHTYWGAGHFISWLEGQIAMLKDSWLHYQPDNEKSQKKSRLLRDAEEVLDDMRYHRSKMDVEPAPPPPPPPPPPPSTSPGSIPSSQLSFEPKLAASPNVADKGEEVSKPRTRKPSRWDNPAVPSTPADHEEEPRTPITKPALSHQVLNSVTEAGDDDQVKFDLQSPSYSPDSSPAAQPRTPSPPRSIVSDGSGYTECSPHSPQSPKV